MFTRELSVAVVGILILGTVGSIGGCVKSKPTQSPMVTISAGELEMGDHFTGGSDGAESPVHRVRVSAFEMGVHEVTNKEYAECVEADACTAPNHTSSLNRETYYDDAAYENYPVVWVGWEQADAYCKWIDKRLPTEAEWEHAARGGLAGKKYPWGDSISAGDANYDYSGDEAYVDTADTTEVEQGGYGKNGYGLYNVGGNVHEYVADWYQSDYYAQSPVDDPAGPVNQQPMPSSMDWPDSPPSAWPTDEPYPPTLPTKLGHVVRGGSFLYDEQYVRVSFRTPSAYDDRQGPPYDLGAPMIGFRCAK